MTAVELLHTHWDSIIELLYWTLAVRSAVPVVAMLGMRGAMK